MLWQQQRSSDYSELAGCLAYGYIRVFFTVEHERGGQRHRARLLVTAGESGVGLRRAEGIKVHASRSSGQEDE